MDANPDDSQSDATKLGRSEGLGLHTLKKALDKTYETMEYESEVFQSFAAGKKPPQKFSDQERDLMLKAILAQALRKQLLKTKAAQLRAQKKEKKEAQQKLGNEPEKSKPKTESQPRNTKKLF